MLTSLAFSGGFCSFFFFFFAFFDLFAVVQDKVDVGHPE